MCIVIEMFPSICDAYIVTNEDGENLVFDTEDEAQRYCDEELHDGVVVGV